MNTELGNRIVENLTKAAAALTIGQLAKALTEETTVLRPALRELRKNGLVSCVGNRRSARYSLVVAAPTENTCSAE